MTDPKLWLPGQPVTAEDPLESILGPGSTVFLVPTAFGYYTLPPGDPAGRVVVPAVELDFERLRRRAIRQLDGLETIEVTNAGITSGLGESAEHMDEFPDGPKLLLEIDEVVYLIGPLKGAPMDWYPKLMDGFAGVFDPLIEGGRRPAIVTRPLKIGEHQPEPPAPAAALPPEPGRNDPCPCASGLKYKKCCGR